MRSVILPYRAFGVWSVYIVTWCPLHRVGHRAIAPILFFLRPPEQSLLLKVRSWNIWRCDKGCHCNHHERETEQSHAQGK